ncbi:hypothetical protein BS47DRAFT_1348021 [Hydnum rufescens UP504]|nr:hypothetical protein BS47DRAFT_1348021 [Hydnum rufescens UP504]
MRKETWLLGQANSQNCVETQRLGPSHLEEVGAYVNCPPSELDRELRHQSSFVPSVESNFVGASTSSGPTETTNRLAYSVCGRPMANFSECNRKQNVPSRS